jgi:hypothetical protein
MKVTFTTNRPLLPFCRFWTKCPEVSQLGMKNDLGFLFCGRHSNDFNNQLNKIKILSALSLHHFDVLSDNGMTTGQPFFPRLSATGHFAAVHHLNALGPLPQLFPPSKRVQGSFHLAISKRLHSIWNIFPKFGCHGDILFTGTAVPPSSENTGSVPPLETFKQIAPLAKLVNEYTTSFAFFLFPLFKTAYNKGSIS